MASEREDMREDREDNWRRGETHKSKENSGHGLRPGPPARASGA